MQLNKTKGKEIVRRLRRMTTKKDYLRGLGDRKGVKKNVTDKNLPNVFIKTEIDKKPLKKVKTDKEFVNDNLYPIENHSFEVMSKEMYKYGPYLSYCKHCNNRNREFYKAQRPKQVGQMMDYLEGKYKQTPIDI